MALKPPVHEGQRIADLLDPLVVGGVAGDQLQAVPQGDGGDHRVGDADGRRTDQFAGDAPASSASAWSKGRTSSRARR